MFIPFLASITLALMLIKLGALSVWVSVLSMSLKAMTVIAIGLALYAIWARRSAR